MEKKIAQYTSRGLDSSGLKETLSHLTDRVIGKDGIESIPLTKQDSIELAKLAVKGDLELEKFGISVIDLVGYEYILKEALSAGITATFVSVALKLGPSLCQALLQVMKGEVLSPESLKELGATAISSGGFAFINGAVSASVVTAFKMGVLGKDLMRVNPSWIGCLSTIVVNIVYKLCLLKTGKISSSVFASDIVKDSIVLAGATGLGILAQTVLPVLGPFAFMLGSLVGTMLSSFLYEKVHSALLSLCWKHGLTLFGIVSLDYQIPESILRGVGIKGFDLDSFEMQSFPLQVLQNESFNFDSFELSSFELGIGLKLVNHNVIEAFKVGYSFV